VTYHAPVPHYRTAAQHARDVYAMRLLEFARPHPASCQCGLCAGSDANDTPADPHEDERGWWDINWEPQE
jgi:hypothetical protein